MNILKSVGLAAYYRIRRISKAVKNWKKFGVIMFGSIFLASNLVPVVQAADELAYLYIDPAAISVEAGQSYQFSYRAYNGYFEPITINPVWSVTNSSAGSITASGLFTAGNSKGTYSNAIKLRAGAISTYARVVVLENTTGDVNQDTDTNNDDSGSDDTGIQDTTPVVQNPESKLTYLYVDPAAISVEMGHTYKFVGRAYDQNWTPMNVPMTWSINKTTAGSVDANGVFTAGNTKGTYENAIKLNSGALSAYARVVVYGDVEQPKVTCKVFRIEPQNSTIYINKTTGVATQDFQLYVEDTNGDTDVNLTNLKWSPADKMVVTGARTARLTTNQPGNIAVSATANCNGAALTDTADVTVVGQPDRVLLNVAITPDMPSVLSGTNVTYHATAYDTNGAIIDPATEPVSFNWMLIGTGPSLGQLLSTTGENVVFKSNPGLQGNYYNFVKVTATYKGLAAADTEGASLYQVVTQNNLSYVKMTVDRDPIYTFDSTPVRAQAYDNFNNPIANCDYNWVEISGPGSITSAANQQVITYGSNSLTGLAHLQVTASCLGESKSTTGTVTVIAVGNDYRVEITPKVGYGVVDSDIYYNVRAYYNGTDVTNASNFNWVITGNAGGYLKDGVGTDAIIHAGNIAGTYNNVLSVTGTYNGLSDYDNASMVVTATVPNYDITTSFNGSLDSRGTAVCTDDVITYVLSVANMQNSVLHNVNVTMPIPANTRFVSATSAGNSPTLNGNNIYWNVGSLALGETKVMTVRVSALETLTSNRTVTATATVNGSEIASRTITANPINLICVTGKGPLPSTGVEWQMLLALISGALGLAGMTYMMMRRRNMYV